jgi:D-alanine-D-alanine ligase-like ATP-grasp enzyme
MKKPVHLDHSQIGSPVVSGVTHDGARLKYARWNVSWSNGRPDPSPERIAMLLSPWCGDVSPSSAPTGATLLNAAALRLAIRLHSRPAPEFEEFVASAPHGSDAEGFGFCFVDPVIASLAAEWAVKTVHEAALQAATAPLRPIDDLVGEAHAAFGHLWPSKDSARVLLEAARRGIPITRVTDHAPVHRLGDGSRQAKVFKMFTQRTPQLATVLTTSKITATQILSRLGFPVPVNYRVATLDEARRFAARIGYPVVVKPNTADFGQGVTAEIRGEEQLARAFERARTFGDVLVEQHIAGENYRLLVIDGVCRGVNHRVQPDVIGDGVRTIAELILDKVSAVAKFPHPDDPTVVGFLAGTGRRLSDVPASGERVRTSAVANASAGGTRVDVTDRVHLDNIRLAEAIAAAFDIDLAGIDLITPDITRSWREAGGAINEVNVNPGLPFPGAPGWVLDGLFPAGSNGRVDVAVVLGDLSGREAGAIVDWVRRGRMPSSRSAILGRPADATGRRQPLDRAQVQPVVDQLLGRAELDSLVVQTAWDGAGPLVLPVPYQARLLVNLDPARQATALGRLKSAMMHDPTVEVTAFDIRAFEPG